MQFQKLLGLSASRFPQNCIICQDFDLPLFASNARKGLFLKIARTNNAIIIALKNNFLAGDAVLALKNSACKNIFLFGPCGVYGSSKIGDMFIIESAFNLESFSKLVAAKETAIFEEEQACPSLTQKIYSKNSAALMKTKSACISSLALEKNFLDFFAKNNISALDMESSIIFSAAKSIKISAACLLYASDHIEKNPIGLALSKSQKQKLSLSRKLLSKIIMGFIDDEHC